MRPAAAILGLLFIALCQSSLAQSSPEPTTTPAEPAEPPTPTSEYVLGKTLQLNCTTDDNEDTTGVSFAWFVNGSALEESVQLQGRFKLLNNSARLTVERTQEDDFGNYSCTAGNLPVNSWSVRGKPILRMLANYNVVEGQKITLVCRVVGKPYPAVTWLYRPMDTCNQTEARDALGELGKFAKLDMSLAGVPNGALTLEAARRDHAGFYSCSAPGAAPAEAALRVKDMYAALWPFLGICAEVFVLCAIILVYEKRRTKPECEDSDTDNHEQ